MTNYSHRNSLKLTLSVRNIQHTSSEFNSTLSTDSAQTILAFSCLFYFSDEQNKKNPTISTTCSLWCWISSDYIFRAFFFINKEVFLKISRREKSEALPLLRDILSKTLSVIIQIVYLKFHSLLTSLAPSFKNDFFCVLRLEYNCIISPFHFSPYLPLYPSF